MFEVKPMSVEKKDTAAGTDESSKVCDGGVGGRGGDSLYLYEGQDWVISPSCSPEEPSAISPVLAEETFRYMKFLAVGSSYPHNDSNSLSEVLSAEQVEQMTKTYSDTDVVTHLLAERDRDLELAARIGQSLLQRNHVLQERNESLEEQLAQALDQVHQLQHELAKKDELLRMVASASEESETDSSCSTPLRHPVPAGTALALSQLDALQSKLQELEEENLSLRSEACHLKKETITYEEKEQQLVSDCVKELRESNSQMVSLADELSQKNEELMRHQEEIAQLLSQIVELQQRVKELALEKEELRIHLRASKEAQRQLTVELKELSDTNAECVGMLHESQEEIKELRSKNMPSADLRRHLSYGLYPMDSLAAEIEGSMRRELSVEEEMVFQDQRSTHKRVFQTVRSVNQSVMRAAASVPPIPGSAHSGLVMTPAPYQSHTPNTEERAGDVDTTKENSHLGQPSSPGGNNLTSALNRLSLRRQNFLCERQFFQAERERKLESEEGGTSCSSPMGSTVSSFTNLSEFSFSSSCFKTFLPEKLQIVKPMEGSLTLHHWQQLAKPHLATILDPHPGVVTKGFRPLPQDSVHHLTDLEEDEDQERLAWEHKRKEKEPQDAEIKEEDEEEEGITFNVHSSSTPEEIGKRRCVQSPANVPPLPASLRNSPVPVATAISLATAVNLTASAAPAVSSGTSASAPPQFQSEAPSTAINPGKYQSSTFSTYTFTTCRILHPRDSTQVTASSACSPSVSDYTPSSLRTGPSTPVTPCRLSLGDSFPIRRPAAPPGGLAKLLLEKGISAQGPAPVAAPKKPLSLRLLPSTPQNSPCPSPVPFDSRSTSSDNFLASRPAELFLQDVYGLKLGRAPRPDLLSPEQPPHGQSNKPDCHTVNLMEHLRKLGLDKKVIQGSDAEGAHPQESATFLATGGGSLLDGLRRNQSLPVMVGRRSASVSSPSRPVPPPHPTSLALPTPPWGNLNEPRRTRRHASLSQAPPYLHNS
ncbi:trafficking kinesin-binding protein 2-like isoform X1 [Carassius gibelio]|uniref:trafficking kinesin-binding protein 2-like isoform X1 n=1 Tax=Carassius gibelio TaxID=101364 RepID=UPI0022787664|nr:trafficking kinesin-binding protein 2-like isoform X1 [Carassius gibelio]XP_052454856.1 trafficking kinesin-binding protein 2-like isoform X1 [Carassius gibelio]